jgi:RNA polymerase sigma-70 factor, ECF subfamily
MRIGIPGDVRAEQSQEFDAFYLATAQRMVAVVYAMTGNLADAEDAVHEAYARAWPRWAALTASGDPTGWVRVVAQRIAVGTWRRARNRLTAHHRQGRAASSASEMSPDHVALVAALRKLTAPQRQAIVLFHLCDMSGADVAAELGVSESTLRTRLTRARKELSRHLVEADMESETRMERTP